MEPHVQDPFFWVLSQLLGQAGSVGIGSLWEKEYLTPGAKAKAGTSAGDLGLDELNQGLGFRVPNKIKIHFWVGLLNAGFCSEIYQAGHFFLVRGLGGPLKRLGIGSHNVWC